MHNTQLNSSISHKFANMAFLCSFFVVVIHCRPIFTEGSVSWWIKQLLEEGICTIAVPFFFVASGFFLAGHIGERYWYRNAINKRIRTLVVPYLIWCLSFIVYICFICWYRDKTLTGIDSVSSWLSWLGFNPLTLPMLSPLWYVRGLLVLVFFSPILLRISDLKFGLLVLFGVYFLVCPGPVGVGWIHSLTRCGIFPLAGIFYFTVGVLLRRRKTIPTIRGWYALGALGLGLGLSCVQAYFRLNQNDFAQYAGCLAIPFMLFGIWNVIPEKGWCPVLISSAFPIYLLHKFFYPVLHMLIGNSDTLLKYMFTVICVFCLALLATVVLRKFFPKIMGIAFGGR